MKIKHVSFGDDITHITFGTGKTGVRRIPIIDSVPYLAQWINIHPYKDDREASLWPVNGVKKTIEYSTMRRILLNIAKSAGIKKRVNPHNFRHSRATELVGLLGAFETQKYLGHSKIQTTQIYVHLSGKALDNKFKEAKGIKKPEEKKNKLEPRMCNRCKYSNEPTALYCSRCGYVLDCKTAIDYEQRRKKIVSWMEKYPDLVTFLEGIVKKEGL